MNNELLESTSSGVVGRSPRQLAWRRFRANKTGIITLSIALFLILSTIFAPLLRDIFGLDPRVRYNELMNSQGFPTGGFNGISWAHPLGLEPGIGHDLLSRLLFGARTSFFVALIVTFSSVSIGLIMGILMGYFRGAVDSTLGRFIDFLLAFPSFFMIVALSLPMVQRLEATGLVEGNSARMTYLVLILIFFGWPYLARIMRSQVLSIRERDYIMAARALGALRNVASSSKRFCPIYGRSSSFTSHFRYLGISRQRRSSPFLVLVCNLQMRRGACSSRIPLNM